MFRRTAKLVRLTAGNFVLGFLHGTAEAKAEKLEKEIETKAERAQGLRQMAEMLKYTRIAWLRKAGMSDEEANATVEADEAEIH